MSSTFDKEMRKSVLRQVGQFRFDLFETATEQTVLKLRSELETKQAAAEKLRTYLPDINEDNYHNISKTQLELVDEYSDLHTDIEYMKGYLFSLLEMRIVYLFKSLEVVMKKIIQTGYAKTNNRDLHRWDNMKTFFKSNDIEIAAIEGYAECIELQKVNNNIKHADVMSDDLRRIEEFSDQKEMNADNLDRFYQRIRPHIKLFSELLAKKVQEDLYDFSNERINKMANELAERMDEIALNAFVVQLKRKLPPENKHDPWLDWDDMPF
jgi:predicted nuclease with TOPRIM domain